MNDMVTLPEGAKVGSVSEGMAILERVKKALTNARYDVIATELIRPMKGQPRGYFNTDRMGRLVESIQRVGQLMPGFVRSIKPNKEGHLFELIDGERRHIAIKTAGVATYRALIVDIDDEAAQYVVSIIANFNREGHTVLEVADSIRAAHEKLRLPMQAIGELIGYHPVYVTNLYGLRRLAPQVRDMLDPEKLKGVKPLPTNAAILISREAPEIQISAANAVMSKEVPLGFLPEYIAQLKGASLLDDEENPEQKPRSQPNAVRRDIRRKMTTASRNINTIQMLLEKTPASILRGMERHELHTLRNQLEGAQTAIAASLAAIRKF